MIVQEMEQDKVRLYQPIELDFNLYLITDRKQMGGRFILKAAEEALKGGFKALQLREKDLGTRELLRLAYEMRELTLRYDARLFINDRVDIAVAVDADGVHLGQKSIPPFAVRRLAGRLIIGVSTHNRQEALQAERDGADFITLGPVYSTPSKAQYGEPMGLERFSHVARELSIPTFAIGGINHDNIKEVIAKGATGGGMISSVFAAKDIRASALKYFRVMK